MPTLVSRSAKICAVALMGMTAAFAQNAPTGKADIVGREMNIAKEEPKAKLAKSVVDLLRSLGHVGFYDGSRVYEMQNNSVDSNGIRRISFSSFKVSYLEYWGARYDSKMKSSAAQKIVAAAEEQKEFGADFSELGLKQPGYYKTVKSGKTTKQEPQRGKFRCDSFVLWCHNQGDSLSSLKYSWSPRAVYAALPGKR